MAQRPFEEHRYVGDKRSMVVHDTENESEACAIDEIVAAEAVALFGPDTLPEARNRGYRPCESCLAAAVTAGGGAASEAAS